MPEFRGAGPELDQVLFVYDGDFRQTPEGEIYSGGGFSTAVWNRYLSFADSVVVAARVRDSDATEGLTLSSRSNVRFVQLPTISTPVNALLKRAAAAEPITKLISSSDVVVARLPSELGLLAISRAKLMGKCVAVELVGHPFDALWNHGSLLLKAYAPILASRVRNAVANADACLYVTKEYLQAEFPCEGVIGSASNVDVEVPAWSDIAPLAMSRRKAGSFKIGLVGSMASNYKGVDVAIRAMADLLGRGYSVELRILGGGDVDRFRDLAKRLNISNKIHFDGTLPAGRAVLEWLDRLDAYIQPSRTEGLPRALVEAMSRGLVCLGSRVGGIPELLGEAATFDVGESTKLAKLIQEVVDASPPLYLERAQLMHRTAEYYDRRENDARRSAFWGEVVRMAR